MRFLVDNSLSWRLAEWLRDEKHDAIHVREIGMSDAEDHSIYERACQESRFIIAQDVDFGTLLWKDVQRRTGVILLRLNSGRMSIQKQRLADLLVSQANEVKPGVVIVLADHAIRIRSF